MLGHGARWGPGRLIRLWEWRHQGVTARSVVARRFEPPPPAPGHLEGRAAQPPERRMDGSGAVLGPAKCYRFPVWKVIERLARAGAAGFGHCGRDGSEGSIAARTAIAQSAAPRSPFGKRLVNDVQAPRAPSR